jgi:hypothetical protein
MALADTNLRPMSAYVTVVEDKAGFLNSRRHVGE